MIGIFYGSSTGNTEEAAHLIRSKLDKESRVINGSFIGLVPDEDNQADMSEERIAAWVASL